MRKGKKRFLLTMVFLFSFLISLLLLSGVALAEDWTQDAGGGFGIAGNNIAYSMAVYGSQLYVGTSNAGGCEVWSYNGDTWNQEVGQSPPGTPGTGPGFGNIANQNADSMAVYNGLLYVGTGNLGGCEVWSYDGLNWTQVVGQSPPGTPGTGPGFGNGNNSDTLSMVVYGGQLYVGTGISFVGACELWSYNGTNWTQVVGPLPGSLLGPGFGNGNNAGITTLALYGAELYAGTGNFVNGCDVWSFNGTAFTQVVGQSPPGTPGTGPGFGNAANQIAWDSEVFGNQLYFGTENIAGGCEIWRYDGTNVTQVVGQGAPGTPTGPGFGNAANTSTRKMVVYGGQLYAEAESGAVGCEIWRFDDIAWTQVIGQGAAGTPTGPGFGNANNLSVRSATVYDLSLIWGTLNNLTGCEIWSTKTSPTWFLAEGATIGGFETWVLVQNPNPAPVNIDIDYMTSTGPVQGPMVAVPGQSRMSFPVNVTVTDFDVSTQVTSTGGDVICERAVYWNLDGGIRVLGHDSIGVPTSSMTWYLAEGATAGGFETWVLVQNPNPNPVDIDIDYMTSTGPVQGPLDTVQGQSRKSYLVNNNVTDFDVSTQVTSLTPGAEIICERAMYWIPDGGTQRVLGHDSKGATTTGSTWFLAEGATAGGFETWVLVQNPNPQAVNIDIKFQTASGQVQGPVDTIFAQSRKSYLVDSWVDTFDVSTRVDSFGGDVICERAMYWTPPGVTQRALGHDSIGVRNNGGLTWYLAEGATLGGFETWVLVQNPNPAPVTIDMKFQTAAGQVQGPIDNIPAESRKSYLVNNWVNTFDVSTRVDSTAGGYIICERAMYWSALPTLDWVLGHDSIGFDP